MPNVTHYETYAALADVYAAAGFASYSETLVPRLLQLAFLEDWVGRVVLDLGCGSGEADCWLAEQGGYRIIAIDTSAEMIRVAQKLAASRNLTVEWVRADMRAFKPSTSVDLALCIGGTLNMLPTLQDLETTFRQVNIALDAGKLFVFDLHTLRGLAESDGVDQIVADDGEKVMVVTRSRFNYETLSVTTIYHIMTHNGVEWRRSDETHVQRGFPLQAIQRALVKTGFKVIKIVNTELQSADPDADDPIIFVAQKVQAP